MFTECPNCHTNFRITSAQLKAAGGKTRCGRCDTVFNAVENLMDDVPDSSDAIAEQTDYLSTVDDGVASTPQDLEQTLSEVDIPGMDDTDEDVADLGVEGLELEDMSAIDDIANDALEMEAGDDDLFSTPAIEDVEGEAIGEELSSSASVAGDEFGGVDLDGDLSALDLDGDLEADDLEDMGLSEDLADGLELEGTDDLDLADEAELDQDLAPEADLEEDLIIADDDLGLPEESLDLDREEMVEQAATEEALPTDTILPELPDESSRFSSLTDEPFDERGVMDEVSKETAEDYVLRELGDGESRSWSWLASIMWMLVILLLLVFLIGQFLYFKRAELVQYPAAKFAIEKLCSVIDRVVPCDVPKPRDLGAIQLLERDVRSHPNTKNALLISATILSGASFVQPFPNLVLTFSDMNQQTIARRVFKPEEYMSSEADIEKGMQPEIPVRVVLEIVDPGPDAVNFEFEFE